MYNDEKIASTDIMDRMRAEFNKHSGKFEQYCGKEENFPQKTAEDFLTSSYSLSKIIECDLRACCKKGRFYEKSKCLSESLTTVFHKILFSGFDDEKTKEYEQKLAEINKVKNYFEKLRPLSVLDFSYFLEEQTDELVLLEPGNVMFLSLAHLSSRLSSLICLAKS